MLIFSAIVATLAAYDLRIIHPTRLVERIENYNEETEMMEAGLLRASMGNFGDISYGQEIRGRVHYPIGLNQDGCLPFEEEHFDGEHL